MEPPTRQPKLQMVAKEDSKRQLSLGCLKKCTNLRHIRETKEQTWMNHVLNDNCNNKKKEKNNKIATTHRVTKVRRLRHLSTVSDTELLLALLGREPETVEYLAWPEQKLRLGYSILMQPTLYLTLINFKDLTHIGNTFWKETGLLHLRLHHSFDSRHRYWDLQRRSTKLTLINQASTKSYICCTLKKEEFKSNDYQDIFGQTRVQGNCHVKVRWITP